MKKIDVFMILLSLLGGVLYFVSDAFLPPAVYPTGPDLTQLICLSPLVFFVIFKILQTAARGRNSFIYAVLVLPITAATLYLLSQWIIENAVKRRDEQQVAAALAQIHDNQRYLKTVSPEVFPDPPQQYVIRDISKDEDLRFLVAQEKPPGVFLTLVIFKQGQPRVLKTEGLPGLKVVRYPWTTGDIQIPLRFELYRGEEAVGFKLDENDLSSVIKIYTKNKNTDLEPAVPFIRLKDVLTKQL